MTSMNFLVMPRFAFAGASSRLRFLQFVEYLQSSGDRVEVQCLVDDAMLGFKYSSGQYSLRRLAAAYWTRLHRLVFGPRADLLWIEKEAFPWLPATLERWVLGSHPVVLDFDDAVFHTYDRHRSSLVRQLMGHRIDRLMSGARLVVAGNEYLAQRARDAGAPWVVIAPTVIDLRRYTPRAEFASSPLARIVWIGSPSTAQYLASLAGPLAQLAQRLPFVLRVIGAQPSPMPGVKVEVLPWSADTEAALLRECDVGVMPLFDTPWERGKCAYKLIQYMACGLPTVASAVGANNEVTIEGETGYLVRSETQWIERLHQLLQDADQRRRLGAAGRLRVEEHYCLQIMAPKMRAWLKQAAMGATCAA